MLLHPPCCADMCHHEGLDHRCMPDDYATDVIALERAALMKKGITSAFVNASIANFLPPFCALKGGVSGMLVCVIPLAVSYRSFSSLQGDGSDGEELPKPKNKSNARLSVVQWIAAFDRRYCLLGMLCGLGRRCGIGCRSSLWNCIRRKPASFSSDGMPPSDERSGVLGNQRPLTFLASRTSARRPGMAGFN